MIPMYPTSDDAQQQELKELLWASCMADHILKQSLGCCREIIEDKDLYGVDLATLAAAHAQISASFYLKAQE